MTIFFLTLITFAAGIIGTVTGFGISTVMVPVVLAFLPLPETLLLVGLIHWFGDIWKMLLFQKSVDKKLLLYFGIPGTFFAILGGYLVVDIPEKTASRIIGIILVTFVLYLLYKPKFRIKPSPAIAVVSGGASGLLGGLTGVGGGALRSVVLTAFNIPKTTYIFTSGILGALIDSGRISAYILSGVRIQNLLLWGFIFFIPASFFGAEVAKKIVNKIPQKVFRNIIAVFLLLLGIKFLTFP